METGGQALPLDWSTFVSWPSGLECGYPLRMLRVAPWIIAAAILAGCGTPASKPDGLDLTVLEGTPFRTVDSEAAVATRLVGDPSWLVGFDPTDRLAFVALREESGATSFCLVLACAVGADRLHLLRLPSGEHPVDALVDARRRDELRARVTAHHLGRPVAGAFAVPLTETLANARLGTPIPRPRNVYAVAANFPSHLEQDLAIDGGHTRRQLLRGARARVFRKHPLVTAPDAVRPAPFTGVIGPFDPLRYPDRIAVPPDSGAEGGPGSTTRLDYEVEVGIVLGRRLTAADAENDARLRAAVAGVVLVSDSKARNPQVVLKVARRAEPIPPAGEPYRFGDEDLDRALGIWDGLTCHWWSHAASWGDYTAIGPFLVEARAADGLTPRGLVCARSYAAPERRGEAVPSGHDIDRLYLRQASRLTENATYEDAMIWTVPDVLRSILASDRNALAFDGRPPELLPGDVVCLGTPAGVVLTARPQGLFDFLAVFLSTWTPIDWHDFFFDGDADLYLNPGDEVFLWAEGLGYQRHVVQRVGDGKGAEAPTRER